MVAQAYDVIHAVPAARAAVSALGRRWVVVGHSQGGAAAVKVAELEADRRDPGYLGAIALAGGGRIDQILEQMARTPNGGYAAFFAYGLKAVYPDFEYAAVLTPEAAALMPVVRDGGWLTTLATVAYRVPMGQVLRPDWQANAHVQRFLAQNTLGERRTAGPLLLLQRLADATVPARTADSLYVRLRRLNRGVEYRAYPGLDHDPLVFGSWRDQVRWVAARFAGRQAPAGARPRVSR